MLLARARPCERRVAVILFYPRNAQRAFDHDEVDAIYDFAIRPILKALKIRPARADRVEHNDDIDDRIFTLIDQSQFCIADLTFARPSVYYEAGNAFGSGKPSSISPVIAHIKSNLDKIPDTQLPPHFQAERLQKNSAVVAKRSIAFPKPPNNHPSHD